MEFLSLDSKKSMGSIDLKFLPSQMSGLAQWNRFNTGIIETGLGVSQHNDVSGNGNHLKQGTDLDRPQKQADGSILCDGIRQFIKADTYTLNQPTTIYLLIKQVTWTASDRLFDGNAFNTGLVFQTGTTPNLTAYAGSVSGQSPDLILNTYGVISVVFNGASGLFQVNKNTAITGNFGAANMSGFVLGADGASANFGNIQYKEAVIFNVAHNTDENLIMQNYLASVGGLSI